ncbi:ComEC/Rec2 family competence protein [Cellulomonas shaoxiangyii]|uniref:ComEC/Rec2 family competence protein n=1 Tax=Cellulomonas shaoxiangyii TaxID=2566013 RepID=A0A4P7SL12_9CELL|nr:ComEC/Rec2 family competence protein [Cellulomonas shaoxiangyii]QCB93233.1 ComEC/Rec2 family competence protein [Cellulomonas shaoxiangyii]TGY77737.1 ComEC/Rec2 family competence protein [Cellulomonas shaoxiangyii]
MTTPAGRVDLRLLPPAATAWGAAALIVLVPADAVGSATAWGLAVLCALGLAVVRVLRDAASYAPSHAPSSAPGSVSRPARARVPPPGVRPAAALAVVVGVAVLTTGAVQRHAAAPAALADAARAGVVVDVVGRVAVPPRVLAGAAGAPPRLLVTVAAEQVRLTSSGALLAAGVHVEVLLPVGDPVGDPAGDPAGDEAAGTQPVDVDAHVAVRGRAATRPAGERAAVGVTARAAPELLGRPRPWFAWSAAARRHARALAGALPGDAGALLPGVTVGDTGAIPVDLRDAMRTAGLAHLTAVSGAHFALLGALALAATAAVDAPRVVRAGAVGAVGVGLVLVVGPDPSVVRAAVMGAVGLVALLAGRRPVGPAALCTAVVVLLVHDPWLAVAPGFALSVGATAGLVALGPPLVERWSGWWGRGAAVVLAAPVAAQLGCLPVVLALWPSLGAWSVAANVLTAPVVAPATVLGLAAVAVAAWWPAAAGVLAAVAGAACWWMGAVARVCAGLPGAALAWLPGPVGAVAAVLAATAAAVLLLRREHRG